MHGSRDDQKLKKGTNRGFVEGNGPLEKEKNPKNKNGPRRFYETEIEDDDSDDSYEEV
jgi:hypothetical protein